MLTEDHAKEGLSRAYLRAIVAAARHNVEIGGREFDYGVDGTVSQLGVRGTRRRETGVKFDFQIKATWDWFLDGTDIVYDLEAKSYNDLVENGIGRSSPFLLVVMCMPQQAANWVAVTTQELILRNALFFVKLTGAQTTNSSSVRIRLPQANLLTPDSLSRILTDIEQGVITP